MSDDEYDPIFANRYRQEDPEVEDVPSDEEAEMAAYLAAKAEQDAPAAKTFKNDEVRSKCSRIVLLTVHALILYRTL